MTTEMYTGLPCLTPLSFDPEVDSQCHCFIQASFDHVSILVTVLYILNWTYNIMLTFPSASSKNSVILQSVAVPSMSDQPGSQEYGASIFLPPVLTFPMTLALGDQIGRTSCSVCPKAHQVQHQYCTTFSGLMGRNCRLEASSILWHKANESTFSS